MDRRTKRQKLEAMANQSASPKEAEIAREKLKNLKDENFNRHYQKYVFISGSGVIIKMDFVDTETDFWK